MGLKTNNNILLAEDDPSSGKLLVDMLKANQYRVDWFQNGEEAWNSFQIGKYALVISDIEMPVMDGRELIRRIFQKDPNQIVIMTTVHNEPEEIIPLMREGVHDYFVKPIPITDLLHRINQASELYDLKRYKASIEKEKLIRLEEQVNWFKWMEERKNDVSQSDSKDKFFYNMRTSLTQGAGFGQLVTIVDKLVKSSKWEDGKYWVKPALMELVKDNLESSWKAIDSFIEIDKLTSDELAKEECTVKEIYSDMIKLVGALNQNFHSIGKEVQISDDKLSFETKTLFGNREYLTKVWRELILNSLKYSPPQTNVGILFATTAQELEVSFINTAGKSDTGIIGVPLEYENIIFEPFYRISHSLDSTIPTNELGLGLSFVRNVITQHSGKVGIQNHKNHANGNKDNEPETIVLTKVLLPIKTEGVE